MLKRIFDIVTAFLLLVILTPFLFLLMLLIRINIGKPIFFKQMRPGLNSLPFKLYKFRTMKELYDDNGELLPDHERLTTFGKFLRASSLDELPELWNVLVGEMSLVGPRPLLKEYLPLYNDFQKRRHLVKPGITGWAQINGRNSISWEDKFKLDVWYVENHSILLDLKILLLTIKKVLLRDGISSQGHVTTERFKGTSS